MSIQFNEFVIHLCCKLPIIASDCMPVFLGYPFTRFIGVSAFCPSVKSLINLFRDITEDFFTYRTYATGTGDSEALLQADREALLASVCSNRKMKAHWYYISDVKDTGGCLV